MNIKLVHIKCVIKSFIKTIFVFGASNMLRSTNICVVCTRCTAVYTESRVHSKRIVKIRQSARTIDRVIHEDTCLESYC